MQTVIHSSDFSLTKALDSFIKKQARASMSNCSNQVDRIVVRLKDVNGPKGGKDKQCSVEVKLPHYAPIVVSKTSSDAYSSIRKALGRASRTTLRRLAKPRNNTQDARLIKNESNKLSLHIEDQLGEQLY